MKSFTVAIVLNKCLPNGVNAIVLLHHIYNARSSDEVLGRATREAMGTNPGHSILFTSVLEIE